ncbi:MAG TPA: serine/threonine-protein kinase [Thermoanaerobaculia bacterium]|nr:serine/threonine-protein kinase [Thermoanaerobaculia bacterium]
MSMADRTRSDSPIPRVTAEANLSPVGIVVDDLIIDGEIHSAPQVAGQPFVVLGERWAWKAYRVAELEQLDAIGRVRREAELALELSGVDGVIGAIAVDEVDGWLLLRMRRMAGTLGDHLAKRELRNEPALSAERYSRLLADVGETLRRLHRRGVVHRDIKPANLLFADDHSRLYVCDFSVAKARRANLTRTGETVGTDSYIAPERWRTGESTPASDQYSLGIVAREVFTGRDAPPLPAPLAQALRTATAVDPDDRFPGVDGCREFGLTLERAVKAEVPRTLPERLRNVKPASRFAWAAAFLGALAFWVATIVDRHPDMVFGLETLILPVVGGLLVFAAMRFLNLPRERRRSQSGARILDLWWPPLLVVGAFLYLGHGAHGITILFLLAIPFGFAFVGSYPPRCGYWLPALVERASRAIDERALLSPMRPLWARVTTFAVLLAVIAYVPIWAQSAFPAPYTGPTALNSAAVIAVHEYREALKRDDIEDACAMMIVSVKAGASCPRFTELQILFAERSEERARSRADGQPLFDETDPSDIGLVEIGTYKGGTVYELSDIDTSRESTEVFGSVVVRKNRDVDVVLTEGPAVTPQEFEAQAAWFYELRQESTFWKVVFTNVCTAGGVSIEGTASNQCGSAMRFTPGAITKLLREAKS